jgi:hypothetical protein
MIVILRNEGNTYRSKTFILVKRVPTKAHHHWVYFTLLTAQAIHLCIAKINPWFAYVTHRDDRFIRKIRCHKSMSYLHGESQTNSPVGQPRSLPPLPKPLWTAPDRKIGNGYSTVAGPTISGRDARNASVRSGAAGLSEDAWRSSAVLSEVVVIVRWVEGRTGRTMSRN